MKVFYSLCSRCSNKSHPEFRQHIQELDIITCSHCGYVLKEIIKDEGYAILEEI